MQKPDLEPHFTDMSSHSSLLDLNINCNLHVYYINLHYQLTHKTGWQKKSFRPGAEQGQNT